MYFKAIWSDKEGSSWYYIEAETAEEARKQVIDMFPEDGNDIIVEPTTVSAILEEEKHTLMCHIQSIYMERHYDMDTITIREYSTVTRELQTNEKKQLEMYRDANRYWRLWSLLKKKCDFTALTVAEMLNAINNLWSTESEDAFQKILGALPLKQ